MNTNIAETVKGFAAIDIVDKASIQEAYPLENII